MFGDKAKRRGLCRGRTGFRDGFSPVAKGRGTPDLRGADSALPESQQGLIIVVKAAVSACTALRKVGTGFSEKRV
jgi:hypothetical protein